MLVDPSDFFSAEEPALQQGDLVLAQLGRLEAEPWAQADPPRTLAAWRTLDSVEHALPSPPGAPPVRFAGGMTPAMVLTHDCQLDKEFLFAYRALRDKGVPKAAAQALVEANQDLDRFVTVAPLLPIDSLRAAPATLRDGEVLGLFPVPEVGELEEGVVDLGYPATIDRCSIIHRWAVLSERARTALRLALARFAALRTPEIGFELEDAVGTRIDAVRRSNRDKALVVLELSDGNEIELLIQPQPPGTGGPARTQAPTSA